MGEYTFLDNDEVDTEIRRILDAAVREIRKEVDVNAIVLAGSLGRGEGTITTESNRTYLLSDYEICVVSPDVRTRTACEKLSKKLSASLRAEISVIWVSSQRFVSNRFANATFGRDNPSIFMYELKAGSRPLYGHEILQRSVLDPTTLPLWEGLKLLLNRMAESLVEPPSCAAKLYAEKWINKTLLACGDILLLDRKLYHYSYNERGRRLSTQVDFTDYPFLNTAQQADLINAYDVKLRGAYDVYCKSDVMRFRKTVDSVFRYAVSSIMGISFSSYAEFPDRYLSAKAILRRLYTYKFYALVHPAYENIIYMVKLVQWGRAPSMRIIARTRVAWHHLVYSVVAPLYFLDHMTTEETQVVLHHVDRIVTLFNRPPSDSPESAKRKLSELWFNICCGKNI